MAPSKTTYHHGDLRAALLQEAAALIEENGTEAVTMRALSERVGVSRTAAYRHFANKTDLLGAVAAEGFRELRERLHRVNTPSAANPEDGFVAMAQAYVQFAVGHPAYYRLMYGRDALQRDQYPDLHAAANAIYDELVTLIVTYQQQGLLKPGDAKPLAYVAWSLVHGLAALIIDRQMETPPDVDALAQLALHTLLQGLLR